MAMFITAIAAWRPLARAARAGLLLALATGLSGATGPISASTALVQAPADAGRQDTAELYQQALRTERVHGDLEAAIGLYRRVVRQDDPELGARALLRIGSAYERLGRDEARAAYQQVLRDYPAQLDAAATARERLAELAEAPALAGRSDGGEVALRRLWSSPEVVDVGGISPDGARLAFVDWGQMRLEGLRGHADLAYVDLATGRARLVTDRPPQTEIDTYVENPLWSADGERLAYTVWDTAWTHRKLHVVRADGRGDRVLVDNPQLRDVRPMAWSPADDFLVARIVGWDDAVRIGLVSLVDGEVRMLRTVGTHPPDPLALSPDGRFIVYDAYPEEDSRTHDIFVLAVDGSREERLVEHPADDVRPFWSPDGRWVVFVSDRSGRRGLWAVPVEDGRPAAEPELLRPDVGPIAPLGVTRSGSLAYRLPVNESDVHLATLDLERGAMRDERPATDRFVGTNGRPRWSPDGRSLAYLSMRGPSGVGDPHLVIRDVEEDVERAYPLPFTPVRRSRPAWSSDGREVLLAGGSPPASVSYRLDVETGKAVRSRYRNDAAGFQGGAQSFASGRQAARLRSLGLRLIGQRGFDLYRDGDEPLRPSEELLWVRDGVARVRSFGEVPDSGLEWVTPQSHMHAWELAPDGGAVALALARDPDVLVSNVLYLLELPDGEPRELLRVPDSLEIMALRWTPDGRHLLYAVADQAQASSEVWIVPASGGRPRRLGIPLSVAEISSSAFHSDGRTVAFERRSTRNEVWLMDGLPWQRSARR